MITEVHFFRDAMNADPFFPFKILLPTRSGTKSLTVPSVYILQVDTKRSCRKVKKYNQHSC